MFLTAEEAEKVKAALHHGTPAEIIDASDVTEAFLRVKKANAEAEAAILDRQWEQHQHRPSVMLDVDVFQTDDGWTAEYSGVFAVGRSPAAACEAFDRIWVGV